MPEDCFIKVFKCMGEIHLEKKEVIKKLGERKKMFEDYLELVRRQTPSQFSKKRPYSIKTVGLQHDPLKQ
jgi:hypothetical protein